MVMMSIWEVARMWSGRFVSAKKMGSHSGLEEAGTVLLRQTRCQVDDDDDDDDEGGGGGGV
jgi:hypothetical protein